MFQAKPSLLGREQGRVAHDEAGETSRVPTAELHFSNFQFFNAVH